MFEGELRKGDRALGFRKDLGMPTKRLNEASKDDLILAMLAALGGEESDVNERDLFLASWHAFPNTMRLSVGTLLKPQVQVSSCHFVARPNLAKSGIERLGSQSLACPSCSCTSRA